METHSFNVDIAKKYGIVEAILLQNICFWIAKNIANNKNFYDGSYWTYNSLEAFMLLFPYLSEKKIRNAIKNLEDKKIIKTGNYNKNNYDRTKWYAIIDEKILSEIGLNSHTAKRANGFGERANGFVQKGRPIPDINTDVNTDILLDKKLNKKYSNIDYIHLLIKGENTKDLEDKFSISKKDVIYVAECLLDWCKGKGKKYKNYNSAMRNWIRNKLEEGKIKKKDPYMYDDSI